jgi:histidinol-phosphatase (PHP family)
MRIQQKENFHTHTFRCGHAAADVPDYAEAAKKAGITVLGISDHTPLPDGWTPEIRMRMRELDGYLAAIRRADRECGISVIAGMECDIHSRYFSFYKNELLIPGRCRYLIGAVHYYTHRGEELYAGLMPSAAHLCSYIDTIISGIESGLFAFIAHPDQFAAGWNRWDGETRSRVRALMDAAKAADIPLEINGNGFRKRSVEFGSLFDAEGPSSPAKGPRPPYPWRPFWEMAAEYGVSYISNSDAHRPADVNASLDLCEALAEDLGLTRGTVKLRDDE